MLNPEKTAIKASPKLIDVLIIGGGLSGLMVAHEINRTLPLASWKLLEARSILGGRLANDDGGHRIDMGGAWIWPHHQPHMRRLTSTLNISTFPQPDDPTSTRIDGGAVQYIHVLANGLPQDHIMLGHSVTKCTLTTKSSEQDYCETAATSDEPLIKVETKDEMLMARRVVIAAPPKLVSKHIEFYPPLSIDKQRAMEASQTWMAGVTKVSLVYRRKFWSEDTSNMGLPSHLGPAFQVYDSSTRDGFISALTFFTLVPSESPAIANDNTLANQVASQMARVWEYFREPDMVKQAKEFTDIHVKRWPIEEYISEDPKPKAINPHPHPVRSLSTSEWDDRLLFAGSETDDTNPGVMEGAVGAALRVVQQLWIILNGEPTIDKETRLINHNSH